MEQEKEIWDVLHRHLKSIFDGDAEAYADTTAADLSLYEWYITPHRQDGLPFHLFMVSHTAPPSPEGSGQEYRYDLLEPRLQIYGDTAIATYTFMLTKRGANGVSHRTHNESRVLVKRDGRWLREAFQATPIVERTAS